MKLLLTWKQQGSAPAMNHRLHLHRILVSESVVPHIEGRNTVALCEKHHENLTSEKSYLSTKYIATLYTYQIWSQFWSARWRQILRRTLHERYRHSEMGIDGGKVHFIVCGREPEDYMCCNNIGKILLNMLCSRNVLSDIHHQVP